MSSAAALFQGLRWQLFRNSSAIVLRQSWWRVATIACCCVIIWLFLFGLSWYGFHELRVRWRIPLDQKLIETLFDVFFFTLTVLLVFSTGIILYSSLFAGSESQFLLASPLPDDHIFAYKFQGAVAFSSWAFVLLGSPVLLAYGLEVSPRGGVTGAPWYYYAILPAFFLGFLLIPGSIGALACLLIVNLVPRVRKQILFGLIFGLFVVVAFLWGYSWYTQAKELGFGSKTWFESLISEISILSGSLVPFHWMSRGIKHAALGRPDEMAYNLGLVWSYGLFFYLVTVWVAGKLYRRGFNRLASGGALRRRYGGHWLDRVLCKPLFFLDQQTQMLIVKDFRAFRRDPAQWAQILIFLGIGVIYFFNMRRFYEHDIRQSFKIGISMLTLAATGFLMCAYTGRFIFPMLSLEGSKFWILGLLPLDRGRLMIGKFVFSSIGCLAVGEFLTVFSNLMLGMPWLIIVVHALTIAMLAFGFSGMSVGLGACMPNFRESDPSKIAVGFGGTVNLIASLMMMGAVISTMAGPMQVVHGRDPDTHLALAAVPWYVWSAMIAGFVLAGAAIWMPMRAGMKNLRAMEF
jgi:ABC-2 type transport system permease protein